MGVETIFAFMWLVCVGRVSCSSTDALCFVGVYAYAYTNEAEQPLGPQVNIFARVKGRVNLRKRATARILQNNCTFDRTALEGKLLLENKI